MLLVVTGVVVSLVLSVASRSFVDVTLSRREKENSEAFAIAESGVEQALLRISEGVLSGALLTDAANLVTGRYEINETSSYEMYLEEGGSAQIDLAGTPSNVEVRWTKGTEDPGTCVEGSGTAPAAVELVVIEGDDTATRSYYNAAGCDLSGNNNFGVALPGDNGFESRVVVSLSGGEKYLRIKPIYHGSTVNVTGSNLVSQLYLIQSQAGTEQEVRTDIEVKRSLAAPGSIFDYALFSKSTILKN